MTDKNGNGINVRVALVYGLFTLAGALVGAWTGREVLSADVRNNTAAIGRLTTQVDKLAVTVTEIALRQAAAISERNAQLKAMNDRMDLFDRDQRDDRRQRK
jgi:hypothetical protein